MEPEKSRRAVADYSLLSNTMPLLNSKTLATVHLLSENSGCYPGNQTVMFPSKGGCLLSSVVWLAQSEWV